MKNLIFALSIALLHLSSIAEPDKWSYGKTNDNKSHWAGVLNDSGSAFMQRCTTSDGNCVWFIALSTLCEEKATFPMLVSSDEGAANILVLCGGAVIADGKPIYQYYFKEFDQIDKVVRGTSGPIGFAMSLQSGQFKVVRFEMTNAVKAVDSMRLLAEQETSKKKRTKDQVL